MPKFKKISPPSDGGKITAFENKISVPLNPVIPFIEGDGIGPDIWAAAKSVIDAAVEKAYKGKNKIAWMEIFAGEKAVKIYGRNQFLPDETIEAIREYIVAIKGPLTTPTGGGIRSINVDLRLKLDLYALIRPVKYYSGSPSPVKKPENLDVVVIRENTEDVFTGIEFKEGSEDCKNLIGYIGRKTGKNLRGDSGITIKSISRYATERIVKKAIVYALENRRKKVTLVHKGNIMKFTEGSFKEWGYETAKNFFSEYIVTEEELLQKYNNRMPDGKILINDRIADTVFQQLLLKPSEYEVLATPNLNGDYLSDSCAAQVGGLGIAPGANFGDIHALFEAAHGSAPKYGGEDIANPASLILSGVMMLNYLGWNKSALLIEKALVKTIKNKTVTYDFARFLRGSNQISCSDFGKEIIKNM